MYCWEGVCRTESYMHVRLVVIAKDEGLFLPEWLYHHLRYGFDSIHVHINRTTDNSLNILAAVQAVHPQVRVRSADWVDAVDNVMVSNSLQRVVYAQAYAEASEDPAVDYLIFLDADELWTSLDGTSTIQDCLTGLGEPDMCSFEWMNVLPEAEETDAPLLTRPVSGSMDVLTKTVLKTRLVMKTVRAHYSSCEAPHEQGGRRLRSCFADGSPYVHGKYIEHLKAPSEVIKPFVILHQVGRTPLNYLASLWRSNPDFIYAGKVTKIKYNRTAKQVFGMDAAHRLEFGAPFYHEYGAGYAAFCQTCGLAPLLREARKFVLMQAVQCLQHLAATPDGELERKAAQGLDIAELRRRANAELMRVPS